MIVCFFSFVFSYIWMSLCCFSFSFFLSFSTYMEDTIYVASVGFFHVSFIVVGVRFFPCFDIDICTLLAREREREWQADILSLLTFFISNKRILSMKKNNTCATF